MDGDFGRPGLACVLKSSRDGGIADMCRETNDNIGVWFIAAEIRHACVWKKVFMRFLSAGPSMNSALSLTGTK